MQRVTVSELVKVRRDREPYTGWGFLGTDHNKRRHAGKACWLVDRKGDFVVSMVKLGCTNLVMREIIFQTDESRRWTCLHKMTVSPQGDCVSTKNRLCLYKIDCVSTR